MEAIKTRSEIKAEETAVEVVPQDLPTIDMVDPKNTINLGDVVDVLQRPIERSESTAPNPPKSVAERNEIFSDDDEREQFQHPKDVVEAVNPEQFNDASSLFVVFLTIVWPLLLYSLDRLLKLGQDYSYYELDDKSQMEIQVKAKPVIAEFMNRPMNPKQDLTVTVVKVAAAQIGGALLIKKLSKVTENEQEE